jgi:type IV conjugative transfer system coupling protein TraD
MLNNFIGGGQVFLHKIRMFQQVFTRTVSVAFLLGAIASVAMHSKELKELDWEAFYSYRKAVLADEFDGAINSLRMTIGKNPTYITYINVKTQSGIVKTDIDPRVIREFRLFQKANSNGMALAVEILIASAFFTSLIFCLIFLLWSKFGKSLKDETVKDGSGIVLTAEQVNRQLKAMKIASDFHIGKTPLVRNAETRHFLVTGSTGSGKTNLLHQLLPQVKRKNQPAIIVDQTGEMIARYYEPERGDIIFNPFDARSKAWDFFTDCSNLEELERFSKILFSFNRKRSKSNSDPFWEQSAEVVFNSCVEYLVKEKDATLSALKAMTIDANLATLHKNLKGTPAERYLTDDGKGMASSVMSMLSTSSKPISYLSDNLDAGSFSLKSHFREIKSGSKAWLFLSTKPSSRELTLPLVACLTELALTQMMDIGINKDRRVWCVFDELASLGNLPALSPLMSEGRKYGACVIAALQSLNQLYDNYGHYGGSSIFGQFGTSFFFRNTEPAIAKLFSDMCGTETITRQQKNTSFGANEFRDGVSYNEHQQRQSIVELNDLASLGVGECYALLPEPKVRLSKLQTPEDKETDKNEGFQQK